MHEETQMKTMIAAAIALALIAGSVTTAFADGRDGQRYERRGDDRYGKKHKTEKHKVEKHRAEKRHGHARAWRGHQAHPHRYTYVRHEPVRYSAGRYVRPPGYYHHGWRRGERLPRAWYSSRYVVRDYHDYHLRTPPHGYHWVRVDNDVILTAIATGLVVEIVSGMFR